MTDRPMTVERLAEFGAAWRRKDLDALMTFMSEDCEFRASVGPEPGSTFVGRAEVRRGFELMLSYDRAAEPLGGSAIVAGSVGVSQWGYRYQHDDGTAVDVRGCDIYEFDGDLIRVKDAYRKVTDSLGDERLTAQERGTA